MSKKTVYEEREEKRRKYAEEHMVKCPHCGEQVLDHMTKCPYCNGELKPTGYVPISDKKAKKIKFILYPILLVVAIVLLYFLVWRK